MGQGAVKQKKDRKRKESGNREVQVTNRRSSMPLYKQSDEARRRQEHQQYLAKESPEPTFDLSNCELDKVPSGVFSLCKVLRKEVLLLHDNWLSSLIGGGRLTDLKSLRVLDVHSNGIFSLPDEIGELTSLQHSTNVMFHSRCHLSSSRELLEDCVQVLNLEKNNLSILPDSVGQLVYLQTLNVKGNKLRYLPESICSLGYLRSLNISMNDVTSLPKALCHVQTIETLCLDSDNMHYPPSGTCEKGTEAIMKFLCADCGLEYLSPSNFLLNILDAPKRLMYGQSGIELSKPFKEQEQLMKTLEEYSIVMESRRGKRVELERQLEADQLKRAALACLAAEQKQDLLLAVAEDQARLEKELNELAKKKEKKRLNLLSCMEEVDQEVTELISHMLLMNEKAKKAEDLAEVMEKERMQKEDWFSVRWEEMHILRQKEVLESMQTSLKESEYFEMIRQSYSTNKDEVLQQALLDDQMLSRGRVESTLYHKDMALRATIEDLCKQEELQKEAFKALQLLKDVKHIRITNQIALIEEELTEITLVEIERKSCKHEEDMNQLAEKRTALIELLTQLLSQQEKRQDELRKRLQDMEQQRLSGQKDYWMVQYQRLMDRKPQALIDQERQIEKAVLTILEKANANDYIPVFARHRVTIETLIWMSEDDLKQMGIHEAGMRKTILQCADGIYTDRKKEAMEDPSDVCGAASHLEPTAPPVENSLIRRHSFVARGINSECSICLDRQSEVIFLYCGHVCCCIECSCALKICPLCRADIVQKVKLLSCSVPVICGSALM